MDCKADSADDGDGEALDISHLFYCLSKMSERFGVVGNLFVEWNKHVYKKNKWSVNKT